MKGDSIAVKVNIVLLKSQVFLSYRNGGLQGKYLNGYQQEHCILLILIVRTKGQRQEEEQKEQTVTFHFRKCTS